MSVGLQVALVLGSLPLAYVVLAVARRARAHSLERRRDERGSASPGPYGSDDEDNRRRRRSQRPGLWH